VSFSHSSRPDYVGITETPGTLITREAASMALSRYELVRRLAAGRRVLDAACGSGQGLGYVAREAAHIVGGDITSGLLAQAQAHYGKSVSLVRFDAHALPFVTGSFELVQIHEAIYYMAQPRLVFEECRRVLSRDGILVVSSINPAWADFNPSPHARGYLGAQELKVTLEGLFRSVDILFGFAVPPSNVGRVAVSVIKRTGRRLKLIPRTMRGKTVLKRMFLGPLVAVPAEIDIAMASIDEPSRAPIDEARRFKTIYAVAKL
jgi:ubiquinone/menaquinone biosynthesis C-methylase UbiE